MHTSKVLWVLLIVFLSSVVECQRPALRDSMLGSMIRNTLSGTRDMIGNIGRGMLRTLDPGSSVRGRGAPRGGGPSRRPQRQRRPGPNSLQQGRIVQEDDDYYDDYDNFEDTTFNNYDYSPSVSGEFNTAFPREPIPSPPNLPFRNNNNNNRIRNNNNRNTSNNFRNPGAGGGRFNSISGAPRQFNKPKVINDLIQRSGLNGPFYPYPTYVG